MVAKAQALDHLAVAHVQAGNYAAGKNGANSSGAMRSSIKRAAADGRRDPGAGEGVQVRAVPHAAGGLPGDRRKAAHALTVERRFGPASAPSRPMSVHST